MKHVLRIVRRDLERKRSSSLVVARQGRDEPATSPITTTQREAVDSAVIAYVQWRAACISVRDAYRRWERAPLVDAELAYRAFGAAVDREQAAAEMYARLMRNVGHLVESGLDYSLDATSSVADAS